MFCISADGVKSDIYVLESFSKLSFSLYINNLVFISDFSLNDILLRLKPDFVGFDNFYESILL